MRFLILPQDAASRPAVLPARRPLSLLAALALLVGSLGLAQPASAAPQQLAVQPSGPDAAVSGGQVQLRLVTGGLSSPLFVTHAGDGSGRLFVVQRGGLVRVVKNGVLQSGSFLDLTAKVAAGGERGLLGLAFHPSFETNRKLYAYYTRSGGDLVIAEYTAAANLASASATTEDPLLVIEHSTYANHNGGMLAFGADGNLYLGTGDGGGSGDPLENAQSKNSLLGKVLRIRPTTNGTYTIPAGNPFAGATPGRDEIWSYGLRNPWRFSFDRANGTMWIADVGQSNWEEINREPAGAGGRNYGWDCREGKHPYESAGCAGGFTDPIIEYSHAFGCSITGGYVYRGTVFDDLIGQYVYGDFCSGNLWSVAAGGTSPVYHGAKNANISSFGEGENGEIYMTDLGGRLYWVVAPPFRDVASSPFLLDIVWLEESGITAGCGGGNFCPLTNVSRGQMAAFLARAENLPATGTDFFDDDDGHPFENDINRLAAAGITSGCNTRAFCPDDPVKRDQMASFLVRALDLPATTTNYFTDDAGNIHEKNINALAKSGITSGCGANVYCPKAFVTREQMAAFLHRAYE